MILNENSKISHISIIINNNNSERNGKSNADMDFVVGQISWETSHAESIAESNAASGLSIVRDTGERKEVRCTPAINVTRFGQLQRS